VGAVAVVSVEHAEAIVKMVSTDDLLAIAVPVGVVPVIVTVCAPTMASVTEAAVNLHVLVKAEQAIAALIDLGYSAA